jgi:hypothetical protein
MTFSVYFEAIRPPDVNLLTFSGSRVYKTVSESNAARISSDRGCPPGVVTLQICGENDFWRLFQAIRPLDVNLLTFSNVAARWFMRRECFRFD